MVERYRSWRRTTCAVVTLCVLAACSGRSKRTEEPAMYAAGATGGTPAGGTSGNGASAGSGGAAGGPLTEVECYDAFDCPTAETCDPPTGECVTPCSGKVFDNGTQHDLANVVPCPPDQVCVDPYSPESTSVGTCYTPCDLAAGIDCPAGFGCFGLNCVRAGSASAGQACTATATTTDCRPGAECFNGTCRAHCDFWNSDAGCSAGALCWNGLASGGIDDGLCLPPDATLGGVDAAAVGSACAPDKSYRECGSDGQAWRGNCGDACPFDCPDCTGESCHLPICLPICRDNSDCTSDLPSCWAGKCVRDVPPMP